jgi:predicted MFS family arabinose efflux permease
VGAILAGASAGRVSQMFGLGTATAVSGLIMAGGCVLSAAAPGVGLFLAGRLIQGLGSGWISGFAMVAVALLFPERHLARVFSAVTGVWGVATVLGPLFGGAVVEAGTWRDVFWLFAAQAALFSAAAPPLLRGTQTRASGDAAAGSGVPWLQLAALGAGVAAIAAADLARAGGVSIALVAAGLAVLAAVTWLDGRCAVRLLPRGAANLSTVCGSGYFAMFTLTAASMGFSIYGPPILQAARGFSPLWAGYAIGAESMAWTVTAVSVAHAGPVWDARWIRIGALMLTASLLVLAASLAAGPLALMLVGACLLGAAFGLSWAFMSRRVLAALSDEDRAIGSSAIAAVRQTGSAAGAAISGVAANFAGLSTGLTTAGARAASVWVFLAVLPLALVGAWAAFRLTGRATPGPA